jgi:hypothetical protein
VLECEALALGTDGTLRDAATGAPAGTCTVRAPLRRFFGSLAPVALSVREEPDGALVFTVGRGWRWFGRWFEVRDANGAFVGSLVLDRGELYVAVRHHGRRRACHRRARGAPRPAVRRRSAREDALARVEPCDSAARSSFLRYRERLTC